MVELILAVVQLGLSEDGFDGIPVGAVTFVEDELDIEALAQIVLGSMVLRQIIGEEGDRDAGILLAETFGELDELLVLACVVEGVEVGDTDVVVDGGGGLSHWTEGVLLVDDGVAVHPRPIAVGVDVLGEEDLVDVEEKTTCLSSFVELLDDGLRSGRKLLLAGIDQGFDQSHLLLLDAEFSIEAPQLRCRDLGVDVPSME